MGPAGTSADAEIRLAGEADMDMLHGALEQLSADLEDRHRASAQDLAAACLGRHPACYGFLAVAADAPVGAALVSPVFSTTRGAAGVYISDLWVSASLRGGGLGRRLLRKAATFGAERWRARFLKLTVYADNTRARAFYEHLGFRFAEMDQTLLLADRDLETLKGETA